MERKALTIEFKDGESGEGQFSATFSSFHVVDRDGDVTMPGAFTEGQAVRIAQWGHNWGALPVGKGVIHADDNRAWVDGAFFLDTTHGTDAYKTVKNLGELQEWSYGFDVKRRREGEFNGQPVRFLEEIEVFEVSPVMLGAGIGTRTDAIKSASTFGDAGTAIIEAVTEYAGRVKARADLRARDGRSLSQADREQVQEILKALSALHSDLDGLLKSGGSRDTQAEARRLYADFLRYESQLNGVQL